MFPTEEQRLKEIELVVNRTSPVFQEAFKAGMEFAARIAERQFYGVAATIREYKEKIKGEDIEELLP